VLLSAYLARIVADLAAAVPGVSVASHPGRFDLGELHRFRLCSPLIRVAFTRVIAVQARQYPALDCQFEAAIVTRRDDAGDAATNALALTHAVLLSLHDDVLASDVGSRPETITAENEYDALLSLAGVHFWRVSWRQTLEPDAGAAADALAAFQTLLATYALPDGGATVATDLVEIPQELP